MNIIHEWIIITSHHPIYSDTVKSYVKSYVISYVKSYVKTYVLVNHDPMYSNTVKSYVISYVKSCVLVNHVRIHVKYYVCICSLS